MVAPYVTRALLKQALKIPDNKTGQDELLDLALQAATDAITARVGGRTFHKDLEPSTRTYSAADRLVRTRSGWRLLVDDVASPLGLSVTPVGGGSEYTVTPWPTGAFSRGEPATALDTTAPGYGWIDVAAIWGWPEVPGAVQQACLLQATRLYRRKDSPEGIAGSAEWGLMRVPSLDPDVRALLDPFRPPAVG